MKLKAFLISLVFSGVVRSTTFLPTPIEERVAHSGFLVWGTITGQSYKKIHKQIVTEYSIKVDKQVGLSSNQLLNPQSFKFVVPGGKWNDLTYKVQGSPKIKIGQEFVLVLKKGKFGNILPDLALSVFSVNREMDSITFVSEVYSDKKGVGWISEKEFQIIIESKFGDRFKTPYLAVDRSIYKGEVENKKGNQSRKIASVDEEMDAREDGRIGIIWLVMFFVFLSIVMTKVYNKNFGK
jgi:hypothetical protein